MRSYNAIENELETERRLMCSATNCPQVWSVDAGNGRLCSAHAWASPKSWARITDGLFTAVARKSQPIEPTPSPPLTHAEKRAIAEKMNILLKQPKDPKKWALDLKAKDDAGHKLSPLQKRFYREALGISV